MHHDSTLHLLKPEITWSYANNKHTLKIISQIRQNNSSPSEFNALVNITHATTHYKATWKNVDPTWITEDSNLAYIMEKHMCVISSEGKYKSNYLKGNLIIRHPNIQLATQIQGPLSEISFTSRGIWTIPAASMEALQLTVPNTKLHAQGKLQKGSNHYFLPKCFVHLSNQNNNITLQCEKGSYQQPISEDLGSLLVHGKIHQVKIPHIHHHWPDLFLHEGSIYMHWRRKTKSGTGNMKLVLSKDSQRDMKTTITLSEISTTTSSQEWSQLNQLGLQCSGYIHNLHISQIHPSLSAQNYPIIQHLGEHAARVQFDLAYQPNQDISIQLQSSVSSETLTGYAQLAFSRDLQLLPSSQLQFIYSMSPDQYKLLFEHASTMPSCLLSKPSNISLSINDLHTQSSWSHIVFQGTLITDPIHFYDENVKTTFIIPHIQGTFETKDLSKKLSYHIQGQYEAPEEDISSTFVSDGNWTNMFQDLRYQQTIQWNHAPSQFILGALPFTSSVQQKILHVTGPYINSEISLLSHPKSHIQISCSLNSDLLQTSASFQFNPHSITLNEDLEATLHVKTSLSLLHERVDIME